MTPRTLTTTGKDGFRHIEKMKRRAQEQADRDDAPMAVVQYDDLVFVRPLGRAQHLCEKHPSAKILHECVPAVPS